MKPLTSVVHDTRRKLKSGKYPVKLRVTFMRKQRYYATNLQLTKAEFAAVMGAAPKGKNKEMRLELQALENKANTIISKLGLFDFDTFEHQLYSDRLAYNDVYAYFYTRIDAYKKNQQIGTASNYACSLHSLKKFKPTLMFGEITVTFLNGYEKWLLGEGKSISTVGIYLRPLRAIVNSAKDEGLLSPDYKYPFGLKSKGKYQIPAARNIKKALDKSTVQKLLKYAAAPGSWEEKAIDFWVFIYLANGMNMMDVAHLKFSNIDGEYIRFSRHKTKATGTNMLPISVYMLDRMKKVIDRQGQKDKTKTALIFPIIDPTTSLEKQRADVQQMTKMVNKYMQLIAIKLKIDKKITTYTARHTFSTVLKRSGVDVQSISEALGHSSVNTTKAYLDSFDDEEKKKMSKLLT